MQSAGTTRISVRWLLAAILVALGGAGLATAADHLPGDRTRPELTARGDAALEPRMDGLVERVRAVASHLETLSAAGRGAVVAVSARDPDRLTAEVAAGDAAARSLEEANGQLRAELADVRASIDLRRVSRANAVRIATIDDAAAATAGLAGEWQRRAGSAAPGVRLVSLLEQHDATVFEATAAGREGRYGAALRTLERAQQQLADARRGRDELAGRADVSTLTQWLDRAAEYDAALVRLYTLQRDNGGEVTDETREALAAVDRAQQALPLDTDALVVITSDIAQGGLNEAVVEIEEARGALADAVDALDSPTGSPDSDLAPQAVVPRGGAAQRPGTPTTQPANS